jgi:hypothetical protein
MCSSRVCVFLAGFFLVQQASSDQAGGFARLDDGIIVKVRNRGPARLTFQRSDGTTGQVPVDQVDGWLGARQAARIVDRILPKVGIKEKHEEVRKQLASLRMAAIPRLVHHLKNGDGHRRMEALASLQFVWSTEAVGPVEAALDDEVPAIRSLAMQLLHTRMGGVREDLLRKAAEDEDPHVSGQALATLLARQPDPDRLADAFRSRDRWRYLHPLLPRYHDRARFGKLTHRILAEGNPEEQASALCALIHQYDLSAQTESAVKTFLTNPDPALRMRAAEYLRWLGSDASLELLRTAADRESDLHCRAAMEAAVTAIGRRQSLFSLALPSEAYRWSGDFSAASNRAVKAWGKDSATFALRIATLDLLRSRPFVPFFEFEGSDNKDPGPARRRGPLSRTREPRRRLRQSKCRLGRFADPLRR